MSDYSHDRRVVPLNGGASFQVPHGNHHWIVRQENGVWNTYTHWGALCEEASNKATADDAIHAVIGDPE